jgi:ankyrin repeat protein
MSTHPALFLRLVAGGLIEDVRREISQDPSLVNANGPHPFVGGRPQSLHLAIENQHWEIFRLLLDAGADLNGNNLEYDHWSPLMLTIQRGHAEMRDELLRRGARVGLAEALLMADDEAVNALLHEVSLPEPVPNGGSWLNFARTPRAIELLLRRGADPTVKDRWGVSPVATMSQLGPSGEPLLRLLLANGATAPPELYARLGDQTTLATLLERDPALLANAEITMQAVEGGHLALVQWLIERGASANGRTAERSRQTLLHSAAWNGNLPMVKLLVNAGADRTALDGEHQTTPLVWAETAIEFSKNEACRDVVAYLANLPK